MIRLGSAVWLAAALTTPANAQVQSTQLEAFGELVVGVWEAPDSRHVHEWGVGRKLIKSSSYFLADDGSWSLVSEGIWYWDAEAEVIRGTLLAIEMPLDRFEYSSRVEGSRVVHRLRAVGAEVLEYRETWTVSDATYDWVLEEESPTGWTRVMGGTYTRVE